MNFNKFAEEVHSTLNLTDGDKFRTLNYIHLCWSTTWETYCLDDEEPLTDNRYVNPDGYAIYMCDAIIWICDMMAEMGLKINRCRAVMHPFMDYDVSLARFLQIMHGWTTTLDTLDPDWDYSNFTRKIIDHVLAYMKRIGIDGERLLVERYNDMKR